MYGLTKSLGGSYTLSLIQLDKNFIEYSQILKERLLKDKILIKFDDNTNDLVDFVFAADGIFSNTRSFFEKKKNEPKFKKAIAARVILKSKSELNISDENISLMLGSNLHIVLYPINKKKELNLVCIMRCKKFDPGNTKQLITDLVLKQNPKLKNIFDNEIKSWPLYFTPKILSSSNKKVFYIGDAFNGFLPTLAQGAGQSIESAYEIFNFCLLYTSPSPRD